jgi:hypothetical protein
MRFKVVADPESNSYDVARTYLLGDTLLKHEVSSIGGNYTFIKGNELTNVVRMLSPSRYKGEIFEAFKVTAY